MTPGPCHSTYAQPCSHHSRVPAALLQGWSPANSNQAVRVEGRSAGIFCCLLRCGSVGVRHVEQYPYKSMAYMATPDVAGINLQTRALSQREAGNPGTELW